MSCLRFDVSFATITTMRFPVSESSAPQPAETAAPSRKTAVMPPDHPPIPEGVTSDTCPVNESARSVWIAAAEGAQQPVAGSSTAPGTAAASRPLSTEREISSIPRGAGAFYRHNTDSPEQPVGAGQAVPPSDHATGAGESVEHEAKGNWVYPSEQQFFNAMLRKNHDPKVADMRTIVPIHNAVNERAWEQVLAWEAGMGGEKCPGGIKLSSFVGRPQERSPKAWLKTVFG